MDAYMSSTLRRRSRRQPPARPPVLEASATFTDGLVAVELRNRGGSRVEFKVETPEGCATYEADGNSSGLVIVNAAAGEDFIVTAGGQELLQATVPGAGAWVPVPQEETHELHEQA